MNKETKHSIDFIHQKVGKYSGFSIPENYFSDVEKEIQSSSFLHSLPKEKGFTTPSNYFDNVNDVIFNKTIKNNTSKTIWLQKQAVKFAPIAAAASVLLFIGINYFASQKLTFDDITIDDIASWYDYGYVDITDSEIASTLTAQELEDELLTSITNENLEDYLNSVNTSTLLTEINE